MNDCCSKWGDYKGKRHAKEFKVEEVKQVTDHGYSAN